MFERNPTAEIAVPRRERTLPDFRHDLGAMNLRQSAGLAFHREPAGKQTGRGPTFGPGGLFPQCSSRANLATVLVMRSGKIVEQGETAKLFDDPQHA